MVISPVHFPSYRFWPRDKRGDSFFDFVFYFRRGSWALAYGLLALAKKRKKEHLTVCFPDYFCREPLEILKQFPITIAFYPVTKKLTPDWEALAQMAKTNAPDAFVLVHYFGFANDLDGATIFCKHHDIDLVEDCAHIMKPCGAVGTSGTMSIWSPWKFFPLPELGVLWAREDVREFVQIPKLHRAVFSLIRWWVKREIQRVLCALRVHWYRSRFLPLKIRGSERGVSTSLNALALKLFQRYIRSANDIYMRRIKNYRILESFFKEKYSEMVFDKTLPDGTAPYVFPCIIQKSAAMVSKKLVAQGIPAFPWSDLSEEIKGDMKNHYWANFYSDHLLVFPIHQSISEWQIQSVKRKIELWLQ